MSKVVLITGGSKGIGKSTCIKFASMGYDIIFNYYSSLNEAKELESNIKNSYNVNCIAIKCDLKNEQEIINMVEIIKEKYNHIDVLVNNAGIAIDCLVEEKTKENFIKTLEVNLIAPFILSREIAKMMNSGSIINVSSTNGIDTYYPYSLDYDASKSGLISLTNNLSQIYAPNIRVNAVAPGWVMTDMNKELDEEYIKEESDKILLNRFATPEEIANVIYFLASDEASYINNSVIRIDGGKKC